MEERKIDKKLIITWIVFAVATILCTTAIVLRLNSDADEITAAEESTSDAQIEDLSFPSRDGMHEMGPSGDVDNWWLSDDGRYCVECSGKGFKGTVTLYINFEADGTINSLYVDTETFAETQDIGTRVLEEDFLAQFIGASSSVSFGDGIDAVSSATYSSKAVLEAVNKALSFVPEA